MLWHVWGGFQGARLNSSNSHHDHHRVDDDIEASANLLQDMMLGDRRPIPAHRDEKGTTQIRLHTVEASPPVNNAQGHDPILR
jgi:hypothetical protein